MIKEAIEKVLELRDPETLKIDGKDFVKKGYDEVVDPIYQPSYLEVRNLSGLVDFVRNNIDKLELQELFIHVVSHKSVYLSSNLKEEEKRKDYIKASIVDYAEGFSYGTKMDTEHFIIQTQTKFVQDENMQAVQRIIGNMSDNVTQSQSDDGISQTVTVKGGIQILAKEKLPNPVELRPFRTFAEIEQPQSKFVLRTHSAQKEGESRVSLSEADGGFWKFDAIVNIKNYFKTNLPEISVIG